MKNIWVEVTVLPRSEVLDVQGRAITQTLQENGQSVQDCRYGKCVQLNIKADNEKLAFAKAKEIAEFVLYNPLTETYHLRAVSS